MPVEEMPSAVRRPRPRLQSNRGSLSSELNRVFVPENPYRLF